MEVVFLYTPVLPKTGLITLLGMSSFYSKLFIVWFAVFMFFVAFNLFNLYKGEYKMKKNKTIEWESKL
jgi:hypothetical protein